MVTSIFLLFGGALAIALIIVKVLFFLTAGALLLVFVSLPIPSPRRGAKKELTARLMIALVALAILQVVLLITAGAGLLLLDVAG